MLPRNIDRLNTDSALLLVVDVQGKLARLVHESAAVIKQIGILIDGCQILNVPIVWAEQLPDKLGTTVPELSDRLSGLTPMIKSSFGCCEDEQINGTIRELRRSQVLLCGIEAHVCIWQTAASLLNQGYQVHLMCDAISSRQPHHCEVACRRIATAGGLLSNVEMALFELLATAQHPKFREVAKLFR